MITDTIDFKEESIDFKNKSINELLVIQTALNERIDEAREQLKAQAEQLGLTCSVNGASKPRKRRGHRDEQ